jgi:RNA polymerase sigma-70 factor (ECF subfamily)
MTEDAPGDHRRGVEEASPEVAGAPGSAPNGPTAAPVLSSAAVAEREIVARVQRGDVAAFDGLVRRYIDRALVVARRITGNTHDAEDLVQDAFMRALDRIGSFDNTRPFGPWFFRVLTNTGLNARRARMLRMTEPEALDAPSGDAGPDEIVERLEIRERFDAALALLSSRQRMIVTWFEVDEVPSSEIAERLGIAQETVRWHLHQARRVLRAALGMVRD